MKVLELRSLAASMMMPAAVQERSGLKNGALILRAAESFEAVLTVDRGLDVSLRESGASIGVILIQSPKTDLPFLIPHFAAAKAALARIRPGEFIAVGG